MMSEDTTKPAAADEAAKLEKITKPARSAKPELPANVIVTQLSHGSVLHNAVAVTE